MKYFMMGIVFLLRNASIRVLKIVVLLAVLPTKFVAALLSPDFSKFTFSLLMTCDSISYDGDICQRRFDEEQGQLV